MKRGEGGRRVVRLEGVEVGKRGNTKKKEVRGEGEEGEVGKRSVEGVRGNVRRGEDITGDGKEGRKYKEVGKVKRREKGAKR